MLPLNQSPSAAARAAWEVEPSVYCQMIHLSQPMGRMGAVLDGVMSDEQVILMCPGGLGLTYSFQKPAEV